MWVVAGSRDVFFVQKTALSGQLTTEKETVTYARKMLNYFGANNLIPSFYSNEHPVYALKPNEQLQAKSPADISKADKMLVGQSVLPCSEFSKSIWDVLGFANKNDVRKVFFKAMAEADRRASLRVRQGAIFGEFAQALQQGQLRSAAAIYNPIFAYEFNRNVEAKAAQGWGGFGVQSSSTKSEQSTLSCWRFKQGFCFVMRTTGMPRMRPRTSTANSAPAKCLSSCNWSTP